MGFKSLFFTESKETSQLETNQVVQQELKTVNIPISSETVTVTVNPTIVNKLCELIDKNNLPGPDYIEYRQSIEALKDIIPDDKTRLLAAFTTIKANYPNFTKEVILNGIDFYIKLILTEQSNVQKELESSSCGQIKTIDNDINSLKNELKFSNREIEELTERLVSIEAQNLSKTSQISSLENELVTIRQVSQQKLDEFQTSVTSLVNKLNEDKTLISSIL